MQVKVKIDGYGVFEIDDNKISELLAWLSNNQGTSIKPSNQIVKEVINNQFTGRTLMNE